MRAVHKRQRRDGPAGDAGVTLIDVVVSMTIMSVFLAMFTTGILQIYRGTNKTEAITNAQSQLNVMFLRLDKEIRYAAGISAPNVTTTGGYYFEEYLTTNTGTMICTQLRFDPTARQLSRRTWTQGASPLVPSAWLPLVSSVDSTVTGTPFTLLDADSTYNFQRLRLRLTAVFGLGASSASKAIDITFSALNTSLTTSSDTACVEGRSVA
jgi:type II secretory pathway pseudopilin PulG